MLECAPAGQTSNARTKGAITNRTHCYILLPLSLVVVQNCVTNSQEGVTVTAATGAGERVCLSVVPRKVQVKEVIYQQSRHLYC